jgi:hypothetical protein
VSAGIPAAILVVTPSITLSTQQPQAGSSVVITGKGFGSRVPVAIKCNDIAATSSPSSDESGNFSYTFSIPSGSQGSYRFTATDQSGNTATLTSGTAPPPPPSSNTPPPPPQNQIQINTTPKPPPVTKTVAKPTVMNPKGESFGFIGSEAVRFIWSEGSGIGSGNITYTLEVSDNFKFVGVKPSMRITGINKTSHALIVDPGTYFWRVKAVDSAGNESDWANSLYAFNVGMLPDWAIIGVIILAIIIGYLILRPSPRRRSQQNNSSPFYYY